MLCILCISCGKFGRPLPPEKVSPEGLEIKDVKPSSEGITFTWLSPQVDTRGKKLRSLGGYNLYRRELLTDDDLTDSYAKYDLLDTVEDKTFPVLEERKNIAKKELKPVRKVSLTDEERTIEYTDKTLEAGKSYVYKIVAYNNSSVEGDIIKAVKVTFNGEQSLIEIFPFESLERSVYDDTKDVNDEIDTGFN